MFFPSLGFQKEETNLGNARQDVRLRLSAECGMKILDSGVMASFVLFEQKTAIYNNNMAEKSIDGPGEPPSVAGLSIASTANAGMIILLGL